MEIKKVSFNILKVFLYLVLVTLAFVTLVPILFSLLGGFKENSELMTSGALLPSKYTFNNYIYAWKTVNFAKYTFNSIIISMSVVVGAVLTSTMSGYVLSRRDFVGKKLLKTMYIWSMFISLGPATLYPIYRVIVGLKINNSHIGIIILQIGAQVASILLVEGYLTGISKEYDEAAILDGCGFFRIYWNIIMPLIKPIIAIVVLLNFKGSWNDYLMPMVISMGNKNITPLTVAVVQMKSSGNMATYWSVILAGTTLSIMPIIILYGFANKQFVAGLTIGGIKG